LAGQGSGPWSLAHDAMLIAIAIVINLFMLFSIYCVLVPVPNDAIVHGLCFQFSYQLFQVLDAHLSEIFLLHIIVR
jgi:hypothetical protein